MKNPIIIEINSMITAMKSLEIYNDFIDMLNTFSNNKDYKDRKANTFEEYDFQGFYFGDFKYHLLEDMKIKLKKFNLDPWANHQALSLTGLIINSGRWISSMKRYEIEDLHRQFLRINFRLLNGLKPKEIIDVIKTTENIFNINKVDEIIALKDILIKQQLKE